MKCLVAILMPEDIAENISAIQQKYKNEEWNITLPPHITLVPPMEVLNISKEILGNIEDGITNIEPFEIELEKIGSFEHKYFVIYQSVKISLDLTNIVDKLSKISKNFAVSITKYKDFIPHMTLSNDLNETEFKEKYPKIKKEIVERSFVCDKVALLSREPNKDKWKIVKTFDLI